MDETKDIVAPSSPIEDQEKAFELVQRKAKLYAASELVPPIYRGNTVAAMANCVIALNIARRIGADELMVMQNLWVIEGKPSWSSPFVIGALNSCGRFTPLQYEIRQLPGKKVTYTQRWKNKATGSTEQKEVVVELAHNLECRAFAYDRSTKEKLIGPPVSYEMAVLEGWWTKNGSKWQTMPELMIRYRASAFFGRLYAPEILNGLGTKEEAEDIFVGQSVVYEDSLSDAAQKSTTSASTDTNVGQPSKNSSVLAPHNSQEKPGNENTGDKEKLIDQTISDLQWLYNTAGIPFPIKNDIKKLLDSKSRDFDALSSMLEKARIGIA
jgi:hypothetical protein